MEEDIVRSWRNFCLIETEKEVVHFFTYDYEEFAGRERRTLIELVISDRAIDKKVFKSAIQSVWNLKGKVTIKEAGANLFTFEFQQTLYLEKVHNGRPWSFDQNLLCLTSFDGKLAPSQIVFTKEPIWV